MTSPMKTKFMMGGTTVSVVKMNEGTALDNLPAGVYTVAYSELTGFYLKINKDMLDLPATIYGNVEKRVEKCINTYNERELSTGILMTGDKGTGKSLFMSLLANVVIKDLDIPVILVRDAFAGSAFVTFIEDIGECCMIFDEFGKMYAAGNNRHNGEDNGPQQKDLLSLMDGVDKTKRMFILTENSELDINDFMLNRPSRIYYHFKYNKLDETSITDYCKDKKVLQEVTDQIIEVCRRSRLFSFDMLQTIVEEHLRYEATVEEAIEDLNIDLKSNEEDMMEILKVVRKGTEEVVTLFGKETKYPVPNRRNSTYIRIDANGEGDDLVQAAESAINLPQEIIDLVKDETYNYEELYLSDSDLTYQKGDELIYDNDKFVVHAKEVPAKRFNYYAF